MLNAAQFYGVSQAPDRRDPSSMLAATNALVNVVTRPMGQKKQPTPGTGTPAATGAPEAAGAEAGSADLIASDALLL